MTKKKPKSQHGKSGQPTKYSTKFNDMAYIACSEGGFTDVKLAKLFKVDKSTITNWKRTHPKFFAQIVKGKDEYNIATAETSLMKRAKGYKYKETTKEPGFVKDDKGKLILDKNGNPQIKMFVSKVVSKEVAPDPGTLRFFLKNRDPERWPDKFDADIGLGDIQVLVQKFSDAPGDEDKKIDE